MRFSKGDRVRVKQSLTKEMCNNAIIPTNFPGMECVFIEYTPSRVKVRDPIYGDWYIPAEYLERINTCMFNKEM